MHIDAFVRPKRWFRGQGLRNFQDDSNERKTQLPDDHVCAHIEVTVVCRLKSHDLNEEVTCEGYYVSHREPSFVSRRKILRGHKQCGPAYGSLIIICYRVSRANHRPSI
jgi:hypothetical protein